MTRSIALLGILVGSTAVFGAGPTAQSSAATTGPHRVRVLKRASCDCCRRWVDHLTHAGFVVDAENVDDLAAAKDAHHVPAALRTCHTAVVDGYVVEGHVPADVIETLLRERPAVTGIGVAGMPKGSPGMESATPDHYQVLAFREGAMSVFAER